MNSPVRILYDSGAELRDADRLLIVGSLITCLLDIGIDRITISAQEVRTEDGTLTRAGLMTVMSVREILRALLNVINAESAEVPRIVNSLMPLTDCTMEARRHNS